MSYTQMSTQLEAALAKTKPPWGVRWPSRGADGQKQFSMGTYAGKVLSINRQGLEGRPAGQRVSSPSNSRACYGEHGGDPYRRW